MTSPGDVMARMRAGHLRSSASTITSLPSLILSRWYRLGAITLFGGSLSTKAVGWATLFLAVAAAEFSFAAWELAIARSASA